MADQAEKRKSSVPPRKTSCLTKLLLLVLLLILGWLGLFFHRHGRLPDLGLASDRQTVMGELTKDAKVAKEKTVEVTQKTADLTCRVASWANRQISDLYKLIKSKIPETKEEISAQVQQTGQEVEKAKGTSSTGKAAGLAAEGNTTSAASRDDPPREPRTGPVRPTLAPWFARAREDYLLGSQHYALTDPVTAPSDQIQRELRLAEPFFVRCLDALEEGAKGRPDAQVEALQEATAKRIVDIRRRLEPDWKPSGSNKPRN
jgi:hypothetical protein